MHNSDKILKLQCEINHLKSEYYEELKVRVLGYTLALIGFFTFPASVIYMTLPYIKTKNYSMLIIYILAVITFLLHFKIESRSEGFLGKLVYFDKSTRNISNIKRIIRNRKEALKILSTGRALTPTEAVKYFL